jgi:carbonic anhydrase/acetyltransferase-like protein (isoleucine patch superfamily)
MLIEHDSRQPQVAKSAYIAPTAVVCGDVRIAEDARVLFGAVVVADGGPVRIGRQSIVMEQAVVRGRSRYPTHIGANVLVGPHSHVNGASSEDSVFLATGASVFPGATIGAGAEVRINGIVHVRTSLPPEGVVPIGWVAVGDPARILPPSEHEAIWEILRERNFVATLFGVERGAPSDELAAITHQYAELFGHHRNDRILD